MEYQSHKPINTVKIYWSSKRVCHIDSHFINVKCRNRAIQWSFRLKLKWMRPCEIISWYYSNGICIYSVYNAIGNSACVDI